MKRTIIAGNWKMNKLFFEVGDFLNELCDFVDETYLGDVQVIVAPPSVYLDLAMEITYESEVSISAQNINEHEFGAYTGEISAPMLHSMEVSYSIIGHSERRKYFFETDEKINQKLKMLLKYKLNPIICVGETLEEREEGITNKIIVSQLEKIFSDIPENENIVIAYEPVWAIGTGRNATPNQAQEVHSFIRKWLSEKYSETFAQKIPIIYGGSVKPENISDLIEQPDINGALIGGASLSIIKFIDMINIALESLK
ncbi:MAG: triose-phosphate isomerase [Candidatus Cloacimonas sp. 4484_275]|nr:MAG: triose-phosphate isomerase [Candidatus Cloacimonas sp. 4484_275]RLC49556.1 MAG: triose-phosphate isomerase [Candidatus Cloacimonadota bacterium]